MARRSTTLLAAALTALALCLAGCGGGGDDGATTTATSANGATTPGDSSGGGSSRARGVRGGDLAVVRAWASTLQRGDIDGAARFFALPSAVSNGTRPIALRTRAQARAFNRSLPCGADVVSARAARGGFFIVTFRLTERPGGDCGDGTGNTARAAFHVSDGLIDHWLRVEDLQSAPSAPSTPS